MIWNDNLNDLESSFFDLSALSYSLPVWVDRMDLTDSNNTLTVSAEFTLEENIRLLVPVYI